MARLTRISLGANFYRIPAALALLGVLGACETTTITQKNKGRPADETRSALFDSRPAMMFSAAQAACSGPGERFVRPAPGVAQCQLLMDPQTTAAIILGFDGAVEDLPRLVISLSETQLGDGWIVTGCAFLKIPMKDGRIRRVIQSDPRVRAKITEMLTRMGGTPTDAVPADVAERCFDV
ncbi:hypothetical protein [Rhodalgimonas zhirmunskyi]|uniref:Uncharacterized protein n=1 Tax=Rhodalgimonas zhirmunskyi TaxID=2964767 RepID=A0AAJ1X2W3_9RHOB|nr:hypothetical protein [Rhodoalgimonas zhirmunskyi]MDQ2092723.1 hypothetical protein [Rhodoalgimonas zhirmunskyi]